MAAVAYHRATGRKAAQPNQRLGYGENFLYMLDAGAKAGCARPPAVLQPRLQGDLRNGNDAASPCHLVAS